MRHEKRPELDTEDESAKYLHIFSMFKMKIAQGTVAIRDKFIHVVLCIECYEAHPQTSIVDGAFTHTMVI